MKNLFRLLIAAVVLIALATPASAELLVASNGVSLIRFDSSNLGSTTTVPITGMQLGETLLGMDFRLTDGLLYGVGSTGTLYTFNYMSGAATFVATLAPDPTDMTNSFSTLNGTSFGFDLNPTVDRFRMVSDTNQNLRINPSTGLVITDTDLNPGTPDVVASAYLNSFVGSTSTTLYAIDHTTNGLYIQNPPNNGTLTLVGTGLGVDPGAATGFAIAAAGNIGFATITTSSSQLYTIDLFTGTATLVGTIGTGLISWSSLAIAPAGTFSFSAPSYTVSESGASITVTVNRLGGSVGTATVDFVTIDSSATAGSDYTDSDQTLTFLPGVTSQTVNVPILNDGLDEPNEVIILSLNSPTGNAVIGPNASQIGIIDDDGASSNGAVAVTGLTNPQRLIRFDTDTPNIVTSNQLITGLQPGETILGIDFRSNTNGILYGLGSTGRLYTIDIDTAIATLAFVLAPDPTDPTNAFAALSGTSFGFDFNPTVDRIRVTSDANQNLRINPNNGLVITDDDLNPGDPNVVGSAYTNSFFQATVTTLYAIDSNTDQLMLQFPPNNGTLSVVGAGLGINVTSTVGFDLTPSNTAFAAMIEGTFSRLYLIDLSLGTATPINKIDTVDTTVAAFALIPNGTIVFSAPTYSVSETGPLASITVNRSGGSYGTVSATFTTSDGTANTPADYGAVNQVLTFGPGVTSIVVSIPIVNDLIDEADETVLMALAGPTGGAVIGTIDDAVLTITDDDLPGAIPALNGFGLLALLLTLAAAGVVALGRRV